MAVVAAADIPVAVAVNTVLVPEAVKMPAAAAVLIIPVVTNQIQ
jgi:hypothetical protein